MSFTVLPDAPTIASFNPTSGVAGDAIAITGTNFTGATSVKFNGVSASFTINSETQISATIPSGCSSGLIEITTPGGAATSSTGFTVNNGDSSGESPSAIAILNNGTVLTTGARSIDFVGGEIAELDDDVMVKIPLGISDNLPEVTTRNNNDWLLIQEATTGGYKRIKVSNFIAGLSDDESPIGTYKDKILSAFPWVYLRLNDTSNPALDSSPNSRNGTYYGSPTFGVTGSINGDSDKAASFNGSTQVVINSIGASTAPFIYTVEARFRTTAANGGIIGFSASSNNSTSGTYDRELSLKDGKLHLYVFVSGAVIIQTEQSFNDGNWHTVTQVLSTNGIQIWVDGSLKASSNVNSAASYNGYWHVGRTEGIGYFNGALDEISITYGELSSSEIQSRHASARA